MSLRPHDDARPVPRLNGACLRTSTAVPAWHGCHAPVTSASEQRALSSSARFNQRTVLGSDVFRTPLGARDGAATVFRKARLIGNEYLTPSQVARVLHVSPKTVSRWASQGNFACLVTMGGHRRFRRRDVENVLRQMAGQEAASSEPAEPKG